MTFSTTASLRTSRPGTPFYGSSTPTITFGGNGVGVTYNTAACNWMVTGNRLFFDLHILLTSKGSSTGTLRLNTEVPIEFVSQDSSAVSIWLETVTAGYASEAVFARVVTGGRSIELGACDAGTGFLVSTTDANVKNDTRFRCSGSWRIA